MKRKIGRKFLVWLIVFTLVLAGGICLVVAKQFERRTIEKYETIGVSLTNGVAALIDGDRILNYMQTKQPDDYYWKMEEQLNLLRDAFALEYLYIIIPGDQEYYYIWSNDFDDDDTIGQSEKYAPGEKAWIMDKMDGADPMSLLLTDHPVYGRQATAASGIYSQGNPIGLVMADFPMREIDQYIRTLTLNISLYVILLMAAYIAIYYYYASRNLVEPIRRLTGAAENMARNLERNIVYQSDIHTGDELETLSKAFEKMDVSLRSYIEDNLRITAERQRMKTELDLAAAIQNDQLPSVFPAFPDHTEFDIYASMTPATIVGGDFYDFFLTDDHHLALVIADVSGHGIPAALFMMISRVLIKNHLQAGESPAEALAGVNRQLLETNDAKLFVTVWLAVVDLDTGRGRAANAGPMNPALCRSGGEYELVRYKHDSPIGILKRLKFNEHEFELHPGDTLFIYTDGVTEAENRVKALFGNDRMLASLNREPGANCAATLENVMNGIRDFVKGAEQFDDITMLCFRYRGKG